MAKYYLLEPEVAGELAADTAMDSSVHPPRVSDLHYDLKGWLGDDLNESFPCFVVTDRCRRAIEGREFSGFEFARAKVSASGEFVELYPGRSLPVFHWLKVTGEAGKDDLGLARDHRLTVSERVLHVPKTLALQHCDVEEVP